MFYSRVSQPVFRGTLVFLGAIFSVPQNNKKIKKHTSSNERNKKILYTSLMKDLDNRLSLKLTNIEPDFAKLCSSLQSQLRTKLD